MTHANDPWRAELVRRSGQTLLLLSLLVAGYVLSRGTRWIGLFGFGLLVLGGGVATWGSALSVRLRGSLLVGVLLFVGGVAIATIGMVPGSVLCLALGTMLASVLFGSRAGSLALLASSLEFLVLGAAGRAETAPAIAIEHLQLASWYRMAAVYTVLVGLAVILVSGALRRVETSLALAHESQERWRRISEASFEGIAFSEDGVVVDANEQLARMLGYELSELVGKPLAELVAPEVEGAHPHRALRKDGGSLPVEVRARVLASEGRALRVTAIRDVSEQARLRDELQKRERLAAVGEVVAGVAHEVRTPLFNISATLDANEHHLETSAESRRSLGILRSQIERLSRVMVDLLDYGRPPEPRLVRGRLAPVLESALRSCDKLAQDAGVSLQFVCADGLPELDLDGERLEQVFHNLLSNAVYHAPRGSQVNISARASERPPGITCTVEDEGPGLQEDELARVFEPFFSRRRGGTGLGLAIVQRIVEQHGGSVHASHRRGGGAAFTVFLPAPRSAG
jgi:signal transduction histidine kinase